MKLVAVVLLFVGLYVLIEMGILGNSPLSLLPGALVNGSASGSSGSSGSSVADGGGGGSVVGRWAADLFGVTGVRSFLAPTNYLSADSGLFTSPAVYEANYLFAPGTKQAVSLPSLPGGKLWTLVKQYTSSAVGGIEVWKAPNGGLIALLHLSSLSMLTTTPGGQSVGISGWPLTAQFGNGVAGPNNAHLAVAADALGATFLDGLNAVRAVGQKVAAS